MDKEELSNTVEKLNAALEALGMSGHEDTRIMPIYSEYWIANELMKFGYDIEMVSRRGCDIILPEKNLRIEVKSGKNNGIWAAASFGRGTQITGAKFDYCVFATYDVDFRVREAMVFSRDQLNKVANKPRPQLAAHPTTNPLYAAQVRQSQ